MYGRRGFCDLQRFSQQALCGVSMAARIGKDLSEGFPVGFFAVVCLVGGG
jgi:hypothetical protein